MPDPDQTVGAVHEPPAHAAFQARLCLAKKEGKFEILAMSAGEGNGWTIDAAVLQASLPLWERSNSFVDHDWNSHTIRDLCGVLTAARWDEAESGIRAIFNPFGPAADIARQVAEDALSSPDLSAGVGFSADIYFTFTGRHIDQIIGINSVDLVIDPARGGKFLRALHSIHSKEPPMTDPIITPASRTSAEAADQPPPDPRLAEAEQELARLQAQSEAMKLAETRQAEFDKIREANEQADRLRIQMCSSVLQSTLMASNLPALMQDRIRADFNGKIFEPADLNARIDADRVMLSALTAGTSVQSVSRISGMYSSEDQLRAAVDDLFGVERSPDYARVDPVRLHGIRELYHLLTGDYDLHGGVFPDRAMFQMTTANFPVLVKNAMNKVLCKAWAEFGKAGYNWWEQIATVQHFTNLNQVTWSLFGTVGSLPTVEEGAEYTPLKIGDGGETSSFIKKGGYFGVTLEAIDRDDTRSLIAAPRELAFAAIREISSAVAALFTSNSAAGPTLADTGALFNATAVTTLGGHHNLLTTALGTDYTAWEAVALDMYNQPMLVANETSYYGTGKPMAIDPKFCLVPRALRGAANTLFVNRQSGYGVENLYYGQVFPITVPEWTDATDWAAVADPHLLPGIMIGERFGIMPEIFIAGNETDPAVFMNDELRIKVRHFSAIGVADFRPLHKSNVAG